MPERFTILVTDGAEEDLRALPTYVRTLILDSVKTHLSYQPTQRSRRIKEMRPNPIAGWELRLGDYRVMYDVDQEQRIVQGPGRG